MESNDYNKLGIKDNASKDEIHKAYRIKMLLYQQLGDDRTEQDEADFKEINDAYNRLCGYDVKVEPEPNYKFKDFLSYNKEKLLIIGFISILVLVFIVQMIQRPVYDLNIALVGDFRVGEPEAEGSEHRFVELHVNPNIDNAVRDAEIGIESPLTVFFRRGRRFVENPGLSANYRDTLQVFTLRLSVGDIDLLILDEENFVDLIGDGGIADGETDFYYDLTGFIEAHNSENTPIPDELLIRSEDGSKIFGINIAGSRIIRNTELTSHEGDMLIASIFSGGRHKEAAFKAAMVILGIL